MSSLPITMPDPSSAAGLASRFAAGEDEKFLLQAFRSFADTAGSLERSYSMLRSEVTRLHEDLAQSHAGLQRSLEENREMRHRLDRILCGLPCGVIVAGSGNAISLINPVGTRLLRAALPAAGGDSLPAVEFRSLEELPQEIHFLLERARSQRLEAEHCFPGGGEEFWLAARHAAVTASEAENLPEEEAGELAEPVSVFILRDVTEEKKMVRERDKHRRQQALAEMSAILAHEIRNPLGSLELFAGLLAKASLPTEARAWVEQVQSGVRTLGATVNNVLHFHSLPALELAPTDLGRLLEWAGGYLLPMAREARVELCLRNRLQGVLFPADRHRLEQVLLNLVLNAIRAMPGGGWVEIAGHRISREPASSAAISVSDTGPGLGTGAAAKIFEPGFSTRPGSPGLGLAVCRKIVEQHGGTLGAANRVGAGASFVMTFPLSSGAFDQEKNRGVQGSE